MGIPSNTHPHHPAQVERLEREALAVELRSKGLRFRQIAEAMTAAVGVPIRAQQAWKYMVDGLKRVRDEMAESADDARQVSLERLDMAVEALMPKVSLGDTKAIQTLVTLEDRRSKLLGLDARRDEPVAPPALTQINIAALSTERLEEALLLLTSGDAPTATARLTGDVEEAQFVARPGEAP